MYSQETRRHHLWNSQIPWYPLSVFLEAFSEICNYFNGSSYSYLLWQRVHYIIPLSNTILFLSWKRAINNIKTFSVTQKLKSFFRFNCFLLFFPHILDGILKFFLNYFIVIQLQFAFFPHHSPPTQPNPPSSLASTLPLGFVHVPLIVVPENPSHHYTLPTSPLVTVRLFLVSMSLVIFCLLFFFCWLCSR